MAGRLLSSLSRPRRLLMPDPPPAHPTDANAVQRQRQRSRTESGSKPRKATASSRTGCIAPRAPPRSLAQPKRESSLRQPSP
eukprot:scaffold27465_cov38-Tisochrysis_lutea.AAC.1